MNINELQQKISGYWNEIENNNFKNSDDVQKCITEILSLLEKGEIRVAEKTDNEWKTNHWIKQAILILFKTKQSKPLKTCKCDSSIGWYDKIDTIIPSRSSEDLSSCNFRSVPGSYVRSGSHIGKECVLMPSFVNIGAFVDTKTMVDTWSTIGSCAQIGKNCHISGGVGIGGVLEPINANPVIIEDNCFIGARSEIAEGVIIEKNSVISMGVYIGSSTKIVDRESGKILYGKVPEGSVVVPGSIPSKTGENINLYAAIIVKKVDEKTRSKIGINEILRDTEKN